MSTQVRQSNGQTPSGDQQYSGPERRGRFVREPDVSMTLPADAAYVAVVRHALAGIAEPLGLSDGLLAGMRLAVTEACTNVVRHAYDDEPGEMHIDVHAYADEVAIEVCDNGRGLQVRPRLSSLGLGLPLIAALADSLQIKRRDDRGGRTWRVRYFRFRGV